MLFFKSNSLNSRGKCRFVQTRQGKEKRFPSSRLASPPGFSSSSGLESQAHPVGGRIHVFFRTHPWYSLPTTENQLPIIKGAFNPTKTRNSSLHMRTSEPPPEVVMSLMCGVRIGQHSMLSAGAVVTHDVPDVSIVVGVPARIAGNAQETMTQQ